MTPDEARDLLARRSRAGGPPQRRDYTREQQVERGRARGRAASAAKQALVLIHTDEYRVLYDAAVADELARLDEKWSS